MSSSTLIEVFGHIVFSFTRGVTEHYNPEEPEFTAESFGYDPLESTGREWYYHPVISPISADRGEEKACPSNFSIVWLRHTLSCCSSSVTNKSDKGFHKAKDPSLSFVSYEHMRASLSFNEAFFEWTLEKTTGNIFLSNYSTDLF